MGNGDCRSLKQYKRNATLQSAKKVRQCPPMSAKDILTNVRQSPPRTIIRRGQLSAADKVRKNFSKKNLHRNNTRRTIVRRRTMFAADMSAARGQMSATRGQTCQLLPDKYVNLSRTNMSAARGWMSAARGQMSANRRLGWNFWCKISNKREFRKF